MSSSGKISMALDEIIQQNKTAKKERKFNTNKRGKNNQDYKHFSNNSGEFRGGRGPRRGGFRGRGQNGNINQNPSTSRQVSK